MINVGCYLVSKLLPEQKVFSSWAIAPWQKQLLISYFNDEINMKVIIFRIYDVTNINFNGLNAHSYFEFQLSLDCTNWTIKGVKPGRDYLTEVGYKVKLNQFFPILRSNTIRSHQADTKQTNDFHDNDSAMPAWGQHVSTYSYYENINGA